MKTDRKVVISILAIAVFNFVFLGNEYMYDNMMMYVIDAGGVVTAPELYSGSQCSRLSAFSGYQLFNW